MPWLANIAYFLAALAYLPVLAYAMIVQKKNRRGWREKVFGPRRFPPCRPSARRIWVHAVSLGEVNATRTLVASLERSIPDAEIVVSTTTDTGYARALALYGEARVFRYPLDFSWAVRRAIRRVNPAMIVLMELEVWYNLVHVARRHAVPVCVVNGRLTERSARRFGWIRPLARSMFSRLQWVAAQDEPIAGRFVAVGTPADHVTVCGSMKWDTAEMTDGVSGADALAVAMGVDRARPLWVAGSTGPGEEEIILTAHRSLLEQHPDLQLAIVPRKPERFDRVADLIANRGFACLRRSSHLDGAPSDRPADPPGTVFLGDTIGELRKLYTLADVVVVGRSLVPMGGSDPMEVAALGKPLLAGPFMQNFAEPMRYLVDAGGARTVSDACEIAAAVRDWLEDGAAAQAAGVHGRAEVQRRQGATDRIVNGLVDVLTQSVR